MITLPKHNVIEIFTVFFLYFSHSIVILISAEGVGGQSLVHIKSSLAMVVTIGSVRLESNHGQIIQCWLEQPVRVNNKAPPTISRIVWQLRGFTPGTQYASGPAEKEKEEITLSR